MRPMLSATPPSFKMGIPSEEELLKDLSRLEFQVGFLCSPKIDGIRAIKYQGQLVSRTLKAIPNRYVQELFKDIPEGLDGELTLGPKEAVMTFNTNQSAIMSEGGQPNVYFNVFDDINEPGLAYSTRYQRLPDLSMYPNVQFVEHELITSIQRLLEFESEQLALGYEGIILRHALRGYKFNRSTFREQGMIKIKRFLDAEAVIEDFEELYRNTNEAQVDERGYTKRSDHLAGMVPAGTLGKLVCKVVTGEFSRTGVKIGSGLDNSLRQTIWQNKQNYVGKIVKFKYQPHGSKDAPRSPIFLGFRDEMDM